MDTLLGYTTMRNISRGKKLNVPREKILKAVIWFRTLEKS